jgi:hypothetical protein
MILRNQHLFCPLNNIRFDAESEQATSSKNNAYKRKQQIIFGNQWRNIELPEVRKKSVRKQKKKIFIERGLEELEHLRSNSESKSFYQ